MYYPAPRDASPEPRLSVLPAQPSRGKQYWLRHTSNCLGVPSSNKPAESFERRAPIQPRSSYYFVLILESTLDAALSSTDISWNPQQSGDFLFAGLTRYYFLSVAARGRTRPTAFSIAACPTAKLTNSHSRLKPPLSGPSPLKRYFPPVLIHSKNSRTVSSNRSM